MEILYTSLTPSQTKISSFPFICSCKVFRAVSLSHLYPIPTSHILIIKKLVFHGLRRNGQLDQMTVYHDEFGDPGDPAPAPVEDEETETEIVIDSGEE